jgi:transposase
MQNTNSQISREASSGREERFSTQTQTQTQSALRHRVIKLGVDVHATFYMVARMVDDGRPQAAQRIAGTEFVGWAAKQKLLAERVVVAYEAGPFGYDLARRLGAVGVECVVVAPQDWDERGKGVKTDRVDAGALLTRLDRWLAGSSKSFSVVRVPTVGQDLARARSRQRDQFRKELSRLICRGRSLLRHLGIGASGTWWRADQERRVRERIGEKYGDAGEAQALWRMLEEWRPVMWSLEEKLAALTSELEKAARERCKAGDGAACDKAAGDKAAGDKAACDGAAGGRPPKGVGLHSSEKVDREVADWGRFTNRRQVAGYAGLTPTVRGSGGRFNDGPIGKSGNPRLRGR